MADNTHYNAGTITLTNGSATVTGLGTLWDGAVEPGDRLYLSATGLSFLIIDVVDDITFTLEVVYPGATQVSVNYNIGIIFSGVRLTEKVRQLVELMGNGALSAYALANPDINQFVYGTGTGTADVAAFTAAGRDFVGKADAGAMKTYLAVTDGTDGADGAAGTNGANASDNLVINGNFTINQRGGVKTPAVGIYGYDRWKGHASGIEQVVEALPAGEYTLTWTGGGSATFGGTTAVSPFKATVTAGNASVIVPGTSTKVSLVLGDHTAGPDPWVDLPEHDELMRCLRYFVTGITSATGGLSAGSGYCGGSVSFPVPMRVAPALSKFAPTYQNIYSSLIYLGASPTATHNDRYGFGHYGVNNSSAASYKFRYEADAEL